MSNLVIRPDLRTSGGEVSDILLDQQYVGTLTLVYREGERISGSIQLDQDTLPREQKDEVIQFAQTYVQSLIDALDVPELNVLVSYSSFDLLEEQAFDFEYDYVDNETRFEDADYEDLDEYKMDQDSVYYELVIVGERRNSVEYHIYDGRKTWIAEAFMTIYGNDVVGEVNWNVMPSEEEIGHVTDLIVSDFDDQEMDAFLMDIKYKGEIIAVEELKHEDLITDHDHELGTDLDDYSVILVRDDEDTLTYDIYRQSFGGIPIGTATVDISQREITGFIDFVELENEHNREHIATLLMNELDKEMDYDTFNLTILHQNEPIDEIWFETETDQIH